MRASAILDPMPSPDPAALEAIAGALAAAMNAHDIDAFASLFAPDYHSHQPVHPDRAFVGSDQVRGNWSSVFADVPDFRAELIGTAVDADTLWSEWRWTGTHDDGSRLDLAGVIVCGVHAGQLTWARLYVEPVETGGEGSTRS
ncbi:MAG TPA: nuclear transport factor 2 family protein [Nitriliruptoraceae bacterium]|nr:nuclear transport factor 2 family protein [Nitriliruptoraceae bacterium]